MSGETAMAEEKAIQAELVGKFPFLEAKIRIPRARRMFAEAPAEQAGEVLAHLADRMQFTILCTITGLDLGATLGAIYHLARPSGIVLSLATAVPKEKPVLQSITARFPAAAAYERELVDLLGFQVQGLPGARGIRCRTTGRRASTRCARTGRRRAFRALRAREIDGGRTK